MRSYNPTFTQKDHPKMVSKKKKKWKQQTNYYNCEDKLELISVLEPLVSDLCECNVVCSVLFTMISFIMICFNGYK